MASNNHVGDRKSRNNNTRIPSLGYYLIITDGKETEPNYFYGLRDSLPNDLKNKIAIKVVNCKTQDLIDKARELSMKESQFKQIWIIFDKDLVIDFDYIINKASNCGISVGWSNPCFEIWLQAYFGTMPNYVSSVECIDGFSKAYKKLFKKEYYKNSKTIYKDLNNISNDEIAIALANEKLNEARKNLYFLLECIQQQRFISLLKK